MGNCLVLLQEKTTIQIMRTDGKILRHRPPLEVHQALSSEFPGHSISDAAAVVHPLDPTTGVRSGQLYHHLLPPKDPIEETGLRTGVVRIKLVISKQELKDLLSLVHRGPSHSSSGDDGAERCVGWRPSLGSIPEGKDF